MFFTGYSSVLRLMRMRSTAIPSADGMAGRALKLSISSVVLRHLKCRCSKGTCSTFTSGEIAERGNTFERQNALYASNVGGLSSRFPMGRRDPPYMARTHAYDIARTFPTGALYHASTPPARGMTAGVWDRAPLTRVAYTNRTNTASGGAYKRGRSPHLISARDGMARAHAGGAHATPERRGAH